MLWKQEREQLGAAGAARACCGEDANSTQNTMQGDWPSLFDCGVLPARLNAGIFEEPLFKLTSFK